MKQFFSIVINHDYDRLDDQTRGISNDLVLVSANSNTTVINNNRLLFRSKTGGLDCYIEDDEVLKSETDILLFWVVCTNEAFYSYTDYPKHINFLNPYYYWLNSEDNTKLLQGEIGAKRLGIPPKNAIGCIGIFLNNFDVSENKEFTVDFKIRRTFWEYHITVKNDQKHWSYNIVDEIGEWTFIQINNSNEIITFLSEKPIAYKKQATNRLKLVWKSEQNRILQEDMEMILPFANSAYRMVSNENKELTPIYLYI